MSAPAIAWIVVGASSLIVMIALTVGLARHVKLLFRSVADFQEQVQPLVGDTAAEAERAATRAAGLSERVPSRRR